MGLSALPLVLSSVQHSNPTSEAVGLRRSSPAPVAPSQSYLRLLFVLGQPIGTTTNHQSATLNTADRKPSSVSVFHYHKMKKGLHPQMQWISYVTQSGRLINVMMSKIHREGKVYHWRARRHMAEKLSNVEKFKRRYANTEEAEANSTPPTNKE